MADIINSVDRSLDMYIYDLYIYIDISLLCEPNDAVRAVAVAKRREYHGPNIFQFEEPVLETQPGVTVVI